MKICLDLYVIHLTNHDDSSTSLILYTITTLFATQISVLSKTGMVRHIIIHARKCWINGISPKKNRQIPPLDYPRVRRVAEEFPHMNFSINGGIDSIESINEHLNNVDGVMIGRKGKQRNIKGGFKTCELSIHLYAFLVIKDPLFLSDIEQGNTKNIYDSHFPEF